MWALMPFENQNHPMPQDKLTVMTRFQILLRFVLFTCFLLLIGCGAHNSIPTAKKPASNEYHGIKVVDDYQWLENSSDPAVSEWSTLQNKQSRAFLDKVPLRPFIEERLQQLFSNVSPNYSDLTWRAGKLFLMKFEPPAQQPVLMSLDSIEDLQQSKVILDPNQLSSDGTTTIDWFVPSHDGKLVAVSLSEKGSESGTLYIYEAETGKKLSDAVPRVQLPTGGGSAAWNVDNSGIFYTRYPAKGERPDVDLMFYQQIYFHKLGTPAEEDKYEFGKDFPRIAETALEASPDGRHLLATVANGDGGEYAHFVRSPSGEWKQITRFEDQVKEAQFGRDPLYIEWGKDDALYLRSTKNAPRGKILRVPLANPDLAQATLVVPQGTNVIQDYRPTASGMYVTFLKGGPSELAFIDYLARTTNHYGREAGRRPARGGANATQGRSRAETNSAPARAEGDAATNLPEAEANGEAAEEEATALAAEASVGAGPQNAATLSAFVPVRGPNFSTPTAIQEMVVTHGDELLLRTETYTQPFTWWHYDAVKTRDHMNRTAMVGTSTVSFDDVEVVREIATSKDGTPIPLNIIRRRGTRLNGDNPTILYGYGGYGINMTPRLDLSRRVWLDQGGVVAIANLRGGGEFGEEWHLSGNLTKKQNVFDDFAACAELLIRSNYTKPSRLAIEGGSNGGLLMGATLTQHPELMRAVVSHVGIYDMLRVELDPNGAFNITEFGTVKEPEQFKALYAYSPYHHVTDKAKYPAVLMLTGEHDGRVNPAHSRKMIARLQSATGLQRPILLRTSASSGHGIGTALGERIQQWADVYAFLFDQLGFDYSLVERGPWSGSLTPHSAVVKARLPRDGMTARLAISKSPLLKRPTFTSSVKSDPESGNVVAFELKDLKPDTQYYYALEVERRIDLKSRGEFHTFPAEGQASFSFAFASCARTGSTSDNFDHIRQQHPLFYMNMGDFHYLNITTNDRTRFRAAYDLVLSSPQQADLYRHVPFVYVWDDHDFGGNNSNRKASSQEAARLTYDEYVPHYPLAFGEGDHPISQAFSVGRVKFILTDLRSERDDSRKKDGPDKTMMGKKQKAWFKQELLESNGKYPLICWVSSVPWIGEVSKNPYQSLKTNHFGYVHHSQTDLFKVVTRTNRNAPPTNEDYWSVYAAERHEIANFIKSNHIQGVCILHGDSHMLAADDGTNADYASGGGAPIPVMCAAPLDQDPSLKGGPYSQGVYKTHGNQGCYGLMTIKDKGSQIDVSYSGRNFKDQEVISLKFSVPANGTLARKK
jgi:prolyl oligopeptidase PreP (S9A serine peptidase family)/phosphodiesterase/alkaline phosphatase D-like protein